MPRIDKMSESPIPMNLIKMMLIGMSKAGKTHYAIQAANAGFNVLYLDGDVGIQTISGKDADGKPNLTPLGQSHLWYIHVGDLFNPNGGINPRMSQLMSEFSSSGRFLWNDSKSCMVQSSYDSEADTVWEFRPASFDSNTVLILDSWTAISTSEMVRQAQIEGVELGESDMHELRSVYQKAGSNLTKLLGRLRAAPCHVIVICHPDEYAKYSSPRKKVSEIKEKDLKLEWTRMVPVSSSRPHSLKLASFFTDVAWLEVNKMGSRVIDFTPSPERDAGGHFHGKAPVEEYSFLNLTKQIGAPEPDPSREFSGFTEFGPGEYQPKTAQVIGKPATAGATAARSVTLASMLKK